jgi:uncharacterized protein (UPF0332 family)
LNQDYDYLDSMKRAEEFVRAARLCLDNKLYNAAVTRAYYGVLHAAVVALVCFAKNQSVRSLMTGKTHTKVAALFDQELVRRAKVFPAYKGIVHGLRELREDADYGSGGGVSAADAQKSVRNAERLLDEIKRKMSDDRINY